MKFHPPNSNLKILLPKKMRNFKNNITIWKNKVLKDKLSLNWYLILINYNRLKYNLTKNN